MFRFLKSIVDDETMGEEIVNTTVKAYYTAKRKYPNDRPFDWVAAAYLARFSVNGIGATEFDAGRAAESFEKFPEPWNARALGLTILYIERPDICGQFPKFTKELEDLANRYAYDPYEPPF